MQSVQNITYKKWLATVYSLVKKKAQINKKSAVNFYT